MAIGSAGSNCANGGVAVTRDPDPVLYVCNGAPGIDGADGKNGNNGAQGPQGPQGPQGQPGSGPTVVWARVNANGSLAAGSGAASAGKLFSSLPGSYQVDFNRDVTNCAIVATPHEIVDANRNTIADGLSIDGENIAALAGGGACVYVNVFRGYDFLGHPSVLDADFSIVATC